MDSTVKMQSQTRNNVFLICVHALKMWMKPVIKSLINISMCVLYNTAIQYMAAPSAKYCTSKVLHLHSDKSLKE